MDEHLCHDLCPCTPDQNQLELDIDEMFDRIDHRKDR